MDEWLCDKCGKPVPLYNDAVALDYLLWFGRAPTALERLMCDARHLFRVEGCQGSPSRAQRFYGELSRDSRYPREDTADWGYRVAYAVLVQAYRAEQPAEPEAPLADDEFYSWAEDPGYW